MSQQEIEKLRRRLENEQRLREEEQRLREEEQRLRQQAEEQLRLQIQNTTLPEFLNACHSHLFLSLKIQRDKDSSTKGNPANADHDSTIAADMSSLSLSQMHPRHSSRLAAKSASVGASAQAKRSQRAGQPRSRPRADQFCVYNKGLGGKVPAFIIEYKAPQGSGSQDQQFFNDNQQLDTRLGCESLHVHGSRGALFKITLWSHGYTFVAKGTPVEFVTGLENEELIYSRLSSIQGRYIPVLLGSLKLRHPFSYDGIAEIVHLMFMSYAGKTLANCHDSDRCQLMQKAEKSLQEIHKLGVLQGDPIPGNMVEENGRVMFIDFERATLQPPRAPLGGISHNHTRGQVKGPKGHSRHDCFDRERQRMRRGLY
ncbi:uncharacterized protein BO80DRAFT_435472 [Aspergillus ibericus CBS 121593]|uniref:Protein kinase domain-containing protein n=1 Tax=Aspergillus ibericus CBS 121593 TaxID=1448316 RepID=A0A395GX20_9EURO|nr:hypothetical protein BO80DRAFT_435472 [Aspergillus ibericus CBS 121593]RAL00087.1 hypothetical protein BO80DRAFT_435472 [Aspergillus ibericus CBS 121593]